MFNFLKEPVTESGIKMRLDNMENEDFRNNMHFAFGRQVAIEIKEKAGWQCEVTGKRYEDGWKLDASHKYTHDKRNPRYNDPDNGICLCLEEHLKQHIELYWDAIENGTDEYMDWAFHSVRLIARRCYREGLRTLDHYAEVPSDIVDDRDVVVEILLEGGLDAKEIII
jgi:hypothetical protein